MRLCYLAAADSIHSYRWIRFFADRGHEIRWISLTAAGVDGARALRPLEITFPPSKALRIVRAAVAGRRLLRTARPHILHAHYAASYGVVAALTGFHPFILTAWGSDVLLTGRSRLGAPLVRFALRRADLITVDADHMAEAVVRFGVPRERIRLVYFGTDTATFRPEARSEALRAHLGTPTVISLRSLEPLYDVGTLIRAAPLVAHEFPDVKFLVAGRGTEEAALRRLAAALGVGDHVVFAGHLPAAELPGYLASADVYVSTALSDAGLAASTAEAMACGLPVVVTDSGENRIWVHSGESGYVVPPRSPQVLAGRIIELLRRPETRARFGRRGREIIVERNDYTREMTKMEELYRLLGGHGDSL